MTLLIALAFITLASNAQLKNNLLKGYKEGDVLEKGIYNDKKAPIIKDAWTGGFASNPIEGAESPKVGKVLTYDGYTEGGPSVLFGFPEGVKGSRISVFSMTDSGKSYAKGGYYLAFLVNFSKLGSSSMAEFLGLSASYVGGSNRGQVYVSRNGNNGIKFGVGLLKVRTETPMSYDYNKTHLLVLKVDYNNNQVSLFVNPDLTSEEPKADAILNGEEGALKAGLRAISFRNRSGYAGNIGNFRFAKSWTDAIGIK